MTEILKQPLPVADSAEVVPIYPPEKSGIMINPISVAKAGLGSFLGVYDIYEVYQRLTLHIDKAWPILGRYETSAAHAGIGFNVAMAACKLLSRLPRPARILASAAGVQGVNIGVEGVQGLASPSHDLFDAWRYGHRTDSRHDAELAAIFGLGYCALDYIGERRAARGGA